MLLLEADKSYHEVAEIVNRARSRVQSWAKTFRHWLIEEYQIELSEKSIYHHLRKL